MELKDRNTPTPQNTHSLKPENKNKKKKKKNPQVIHQNSKLGPSMKLENLFSIRNEWKWKVFAAVVVVFFFILPLDDE